MENVPDEDSDKESDGETNPYTEEESKGEQPQGKGKFQAAMSWFGQKKGEAAQAVKEKKAAAAKAMQEKKEAAAAIMKEKTGVAG